MEYNLEPFKQTFVDESLELISNIETKLLSNNDCNHLELIDEIFRCAHSIKSSSAMFNLVEVTRFTHVLENYFERLRSNKKLLDDDVDIIIESLDALREMINAVMNDGKVSNEKSQGVVSKIEVISNKESQGVNKSEQYCYYIEFEPHENIYLCGDDPLRIVKELQSIGEIECSVEALRLPELNDFSPDLNYLKWNIKIRTKYEENEIRNQIFEWLSDDSKIKFTEFFENSIVSNDSKAITHFVDNGTVRIDATKIDQIINMVGELIITQNALNHLCEQSKQEIPEKMLCILNQLENSCRKLQETAIQIRMVPMSQIFNKLPRLIHDLSHKSHKKVNISIEGEQTELDKSLIEKISDPIIHLIRNCVDHGIETHSERLAHGKSEVGNISVSCKQQGTDIMIGISDDGKGIDISNVISKAKKLGLIDDNQALNDFNAIDVIFFPGFTTKESVSDISGRGVGMDIVKKNIEAINGKIYVTTKVGKGTQFEIVLPQLLSIIEGQIVKIDSTYYVIPIANIKETIKLEASKVTYLPNGTMAYIVRNQLVNIVKINGSNIKEKCEENIGYKLLAIIESENANYGILIDELLNLQQTVIKPIEHEFIYSKYFSGASILPDGSLAYVFNTSRIDDFLLMKNNIDSQFLESTGVQ